MTNYKWRTIGIFATALIGLSLGVWVSPKLGSRPQSIFWASYPKYDAVDDLMRASDLVVRGIVLDPGTPYIEYGRHSADDPMVEGDGVPMRLFNVQLLNPDGGEQTVARVVQVATLDVDDAVAPGSPRLNQVEEVFLYLAEVDNKTYPVDLVENDSYYVVIGGRQGVFRSRGGGLWSQDPELGWAQEGGETGATPLVVDEAYVAATASR